MISSDIISSYRNEIFSEEINFIGKGSFGKVYRVFNKLDNCYYAIKRIIITEQNIKTALREIRILASVSHPHIVRYYNSWIESRPFNTIEEMREDDSDLDSSSSDTILKIHNECYVFHIQMEYCDSTLRSYMKNRTSIDIHQCHDIIYQIIDGLYILHHRGIIHRDLKPDNILIQNNQIKITDFGLAKIFTPSNLVDDTSLYIGNYIYASPEQFYGHRYDMSTDIYSLGIIMYEIQFLFLTDMERVITIQQLRNDQIIRPNKYKDLILSMTNKNPTERPSIINMKMYFDPILSHPVVFCRDILWDIISKIE